MPGWLKRIGRALRHRNYRLFFIGQLVSLCGSWISSTATSWLVYRLTESPLALGLSTFLTMFPSFVMGPFSGVIADRLNRRKLLLLTQLGAIMQSSALALLVFSGRENIEAVLTLCFLGGLVRALEMPTRHALVPEMVPLRDDLPNAIALNSALFNGARLIGPPIGGLLIAVWGEGVCFAVDAASYGIFAVCLMMLNLAAPLRNNGPFAWGKEVREGLRYAFSFVPVRNALLMVALVSLAATPYSVLLPVFTREIYDGGPKMLGVLMSCAGLGAFCAALLLASLGSARRLPAAMTWVGLSLALSLILFGLNEIVWIAGGLLFLIGFFFLLVTASSNTIIQDRVDDDKRGRVMSLYVMSFTGMMPLAGILAGYSAEIFGPGVTIMAGGILCGLGAWKIRGRSDSA